MKKVYLCLIGMIACLVLSACGKECVHEFVFTTTVEASCVEMGVSTATCKLCDYSYTEPINKTDHTYDDGSVTAEASCQTEGTRTYICSVCNDTKTETIPVVEHEFDEGVETQAPSCEVMGVITYTCQHCGETKTGEINTLEHTFGEKATTSEATCVAEGEISVICTLCGYQELVETTPKSDKHNYKNNVIRKPTCADRGKGEKVCTLCGHSVACDYDLADHSYGNEVVTKEATCSAKGEKTSTCSVCGYVKTKSISKKDHTWSAAECNSYAKCTVCGSKSSEKTGHDYVLENHYKPNDYFAGEKWYTCSRCGKTKTKIYGATGNYDLDAAKEAGLKRAKELGFGTGTVTTEESGSRVQKLSEYYFQMEFAGGQKKLEKMAVSLVNSIYKIHSLSASTVSQYNIKISVTYGTSGALGTGYFNVVVSIHDKE